VAAHQRQRLSSGAVVGDLLQPTHLLFVLVVALLVLGPKRLPEVGRALGRGLRDFRSAISGEEPPERAITHAEQNDPSSVAAHQPGSVRPHAPEASSSAAPDLAATHEPGAQPSEAPTRPEAPASSSAAAPSDAVTSQAAAPSEAVTSSMKSDSPT
jgi:sec-independent protein translocase protein TatA